MNEKTPLPEAQRRRKAPANPEPASRAQMDALWTVSEVARFLGKSKDWCYRWAQAGRLPSVRIGANVRFDPHQIEAWVKSGGGAR